MKRRERLMQAQVQEQVQLEQVILEQAQVEQTQMEQTQVKQQGPDQEEAAAPYLVRICTNRQTDRQTDRQIDRYASITVNLAHIHNI